ncbi:MAG: hypothetical protein AB1305_02675 [Candidatus Hadarchaeota archaeon]
MKSAAFLLALAIAASAWLWIVPACEGQEGEQAPTSPGGETEPTQPTDGDSANPTHPSWPDEPADPTTDNQYVPTPEGAYTLSNEAKVILTVAAIGAIFLAAFIYYRRL